MTVDQVEQIKRVLEPAVREAIREVLEDEFRPFVERIAILERDVGILKESRRSLFGIWTFVVFVVTFVGKAIWDFISAKLSHRP